MYHHFCRITMLGYPIFGQPTIEGLLHTNCAIRSGIWAILPVTPIAVVPLLSNPVEMYVLYATTLEIAKCALVPQLVVAWNMSSKGLASPLDP